MGGLFRTIGPIDLVKSNRDISEKMVNVLFSEICGAPRGLEEAIGVYIVVSRAADRATIPWYVGKTEKGFSKRFLQHSRLKRGFGDLSKIPAGGKLAVFFIALISEKSGKFRKPVSTSRTVLSIKSLEERLIGTCLRLNKELLNTSNKTLNEALRVPGYLGDENIERDPAASELALMLKTT